MHLSGQLKIGFKAAPLRKDSQKPGVQTFLKMSRQFWFPLQASSMPFGD
ncbi:hypothetical protein SynBIOSE41_02983 [Synechococcus sp. BIOS-E4-1]|nr:hypothetical protein SynBIOSE41_02983 [Synechococcus sp. BIOS-E4-1]